MNGDLAERLFQRAADDVDANLFVAFSFSLSSEPMTRSRATPPPGNDAFFDRGAGGMQGIFDAGLLFLHLGFGGGADLDHRHAADQLGQPFLQLLAVVVGGGLFDLDAHLLDPALDVGRACRRLR